MTIEKINAMPERDFVDSIGWVFEHAPWVADRVWPSRPFATVDALHRAMTDAVSAAGRDEQLALLRAHPDLGARVRLTAASASEQSGAGLDRLSPDDRDRLLRLNDRYRERFGFPFILAVKGAAAPAILEALERRVDSTPDREWTDALAQVARIARGPLDEAIGEGR